MKLKLLAFATILLLTGGCNRPPRPEHVSGSTATSPPSDEQKAGEPSLLANSLLVFDLSGSMKERMCDSQDRKIEVAKSAIIQIVDRVPDRHNIGLLTFSRGKVKLEVPMGKIIPERFNRVIEQLETGGNTPLNQAIRAGTDILVRRMERQQHYGTFNMLIVTDGEATDGPPGREKDTTDSVKYATDRNVTITTIGLCLAEEHSLRRDVFAYRNAKSRIELEQALRQALAEQELKDHEFPAPGKR